MDPSPRPLAAVDFFALDLAGGNIHSAHLALGLAYSTVHKIGRGESTPKPTTAKALERWSRELPSARVAGVYLSASLTLGLSSSEAA